MPILATVIQHSFRSPSHGIREEKKKKKGIQIKKEEVRFSLFADDTKLYIENPKDAIRKLLELINEYYKVTGYKIIHRNPLHSYTLTMKKSEIKETIPFTIAAKRLKYLGINLPKETKDLYARNYKTLIK